MRIDRLSTDEALRSLRSGRQGLSSAEAARRMREFGPNRVEKLGRAPAWLRLLQEFSHFFSVILWIAAALAFFAEWNDPGEGMARIGFALIAVILVSGAFSFWQEFRVERTLAALQKLLPQQVQAMRDGRIRRLLAEQLVVGDVILLEQGDNIPADCRLVEAFDLRVNMATVTGEAMALPRDCAPSREQDLIRSRNIVLASTAVVSGRGQGLVFATGALTEFGKIAHLTQATGVPVSPLRRELAHLSRLIAALAIAIGAAFFVAGAFIQLAFWQDLIFSIGIIVAMVPEGLLPTLTLALVLAAQRMARRHVLIRHLASVETLGSTTVICTDKTGTLTENRMQVRELFLGHSRISADRLARQGELIRRQRAFFLGAAFCHDLTEIENSVGRRLLGDPMEIALVEMAHRAIGRPAASKRLDEVPFDADRMRQSVVQATPEGPVAYCKGAPESVLSICTDIVEDGGRHPLDEPARAAIVAAQETMAGRGLRVLALAWRKLPRGYAHDAIEQDLVFLGLVGLEDPPRPEVPGAIRRCHEAGIKVVMVTGDHPDTAVAIARQIGLVRSPELVVMTGEQLRGLPTAQLQVALDAPDIVFARVAPEQKMRIVEALKRKKHIVAVTGDGVNDAPALKAAHIGIAMGLAGTDVAKAAADMVLLDDNFASIVGAVEEGRAVFDNIRKFLTYVLVHNVAELVPYLAFALLRIPLPLTPIQALSVDMGTDTFTALGLGVERPDPAIMRARPRPPDERLLNWPLALRAYLFLGTVEAAGAMAAYFFILFGGGWRFGQGLAADDPLHMQATTACLSAIVVMQIVNVFLCRSPVRSVLSTRLFGNRLIVFGVAVEIALIVAFVYTPLGNFLLGTAPLPGDLWLFLLPWGLAMLALEELRKGIARRITRRRGKAPGQAPAGQAGGPPTLRGGAPTGR